ncbi:unnamed protein product, partial [Closterium sp. NIES-53]
VLKRFGFQFSSPQPTPLSTGHPLSAPPCGPYPELVGCLMYLMTCTQPDLAYPLSLLARYVAPARHRKATQRSSQGYTFSLGFGSVSWRSTRSSSVLGSSFRYVDNKTTLALCREQRPEHRTKHIALRYFLARELQQRRQLRLSYVASRNNTVDVFTKAIGSGDHQHFCTALGLVPTLPHLLVA